MDKSKGGQILQGEVVSRKMQKTAVVKVTTTKRHPKYHKQFKVSRRYKAHDEQNQYQVGDMVLLQETRPISKEKRWTILSKVK